MATVATPTTTRMKSAPALPGSRSDHFFFPGMAWLLLIVVFIGFAPTYYLAGAFSATLPSLIIHVHAVVFSCWILLLITQTSLVAAGRVDIHRRLGIFGFVLACLMVIVGVMAATDSLVREAGPPGRDPKFFYIVPLMAMVVFATLITFAFRNRSNPAAHKRLILIATIGLMVAAIGRWPFVYVHKNVFHATLISYVFLLMLVLYDLWSMHKIHRATLWAGAFLIFMSQARLPIGRTAAWHAFATWVQHLFR